VKTLIVMAIVLALTGGAQAAYKTGNDWIDHCNKGNHDTGFGSLNWGYCYGYTVGVADAMQVTHPQVCIQRGVEAQQLVAVAANFMRRNPQWRHRDASVVLGAAFAEAWPCQQPRAETPAPRGGGGFQTVPSR
jgi:hypothetical protein